MKGNLTQFPPTSPFAKSCMQELTTDSDAKICLFQALALTPECPPGISLKRNVRPETDTSTARCRQEVSSSGDPSEFCRVLKGLSKNKNTKNTAGAMNSQLTDPLMNWRLQEALKGSPIAQRLQTSSSLDDTLQEDAFSPSSSTPPDATHVPFSSLAAKMDASSFRRPECGESSYSLGSAETETEPSGSLQSTASGDLEMQWIENYVSHDLRFEAQAFKGDPTTLMIRNIPLSLTQEALALKWPNNGSYDFFYVPSREPCQRNTQWNKSYAFINFTSPQAALDFKERWDKVRLPQSMASRTISVTCADVQGQVANLLQLIKKRRWRLKVKECQPLIFNNDGAQITLEEAFQGLEAGGMLWSL